MYERLKAVFERLDVQYEIIFVNDSSPDDAQEVLAELASTDEHVVVVTHARNFGSQSAFTSGMRIATGDAVVLLDGDLQDPPELIEEFAAKWQEGYEVVYGRRVKRETTRTMQLLYKLFYRVFRSMSYVRVPVDAGDFSLMDRRVVDAMNALPECNRFMRGLRAWVGFKQIGVPYVRPERPFGESTNSLIRNLGWARKAIFSFSYAPLDFITWLALTTVGLTVLATFGQITARLVAPELVPRGVTTIILVVLFIGGIQLLCLAIIGSYLAHIYDEVKRRPAYVVSSIINSPGGRKDADDDRPVHAG